MIQPNEEENIIVTCHGLADLAGVDIDTLDGEV